jgi:hypothetical protein
MFPLFFKTNLPWIGSIFVVRILYYISQIFIWIFSCSIFTLIIIALIYTRLAAASDKVYQLLAHCRWFSPGTPASTTTKAVRHDIAEILNTKNQNQSALIYCATRWKSLHLYIKGEYFLHTCQLDQVWSYSLDIFKYGKFTIRKEKIPYAI